MTAVLAIDPGTTYSGWVLMRNGTLWNCGVSENREIIDMITGTAVPVAIERVVSYGMAIGAETIETIEWVGRFHQAAGWDRARLIPRKEVCQHVCNSARAKDPNIRQALIDRWGGKAIAIGNVKNPGPLYPVKSHAWQALGVAVTALETKAS